MNDILTDLIASWREETRDPQELTDRLLSTVLGMGKDSARELLHPVVLPWVRQRESERDKVLKAEQRVFDRSAPRYGNPAQEAMRALLAGTCYVEGQGAVPWGEMTAEHHRIRRDFLARTRDAYVSGVNATIGRHEVAMTLLADSGYQNLNAYVAENGELPRDLLEDETGAVAPA